MATNENQPEQQPKVARGKAIIRTDEELNEMCSAEAMMALADDAAEDFREHAPKPFKTILGSTSSTRKGKE